MPRNTNPIKMNFWDEKEAKRLLQKLTFYNTFIKKRRLKHLQDMNLPQELPFYDELSIEKISKVFKTQTRSYKIEIIDLKDSLVPLKASKSSIKDLFKDLLDEIKDFKYQITVEFFLTKHREMETYNLFLFI